MKIKVLFFAKLRELFGTNQVDVTFTESNNKVSDVLAALRQKGEVWAEELNENKSFRIAVNQEMVTEDVMINEGDEMALFPPVTGG
ncbi:MAG: molybdopterin converting factor subunit 1 [Proteobacteria bacterium]|nr:molybdopterin converting factor subunit 1 [Pseudomonadota bacterium]MDA0861843.1 molybdopterin converting factor subunit 1 [Pseudomonadota bacterium]MDA1029949.1 molybdopterin converting factor subunit 1 [Pseudomonadota bacterium]